MPEFSVVIPVFNERTNLEPLLKGLRAALTGIDFEVIVVDDDSPDETAEACRAIAQADPRVRIIQRIHRKGLSSAVIEGLMSSSAPYMAVMDGDLQHDEMILPHMLAKLKAENLDLVIGTRHTEGGSMGEFAKERVALSNMGNRLSRLVCRADISDPMSGYFVIDRRFLHEVVRRLSSTGFKVLIDLMASSHRPVRLGEVGYRFRQRFSGDSKLDILVGLEYLKLLADKLLGNWIPVNFMVFSTVGLVGLVVHLTLVFAQIRLLGIRFEGAQAASSSVVIALNFFLNNILTFRAQRLRGWRVLWGLVLFYMACSIGLLTNIWVGAALRDTGVYWTFASTVGIVIGSVWNYWMTSAFVWGVNRRRAATAATRRLISSRGGATPNTVSSRAVS